MVDLLVVNNVNLNPQIITSGLRDKQSTTPTRGSA